MSAMAIASSPPRDSAHAAVKNTRLRGASDKLKESFGLEWQVFPSVGSLMIARLWHGRTKAADAVEYKRYLFNSGIPAYRATAGNRGAWVLCRPEGDIAHFLTLSFWESWDAIKTFAGEAIETARYFPEDEKYLLEFEPTVTHYEVFD